MTTPQGLGTCPSDLLQDIVLRLQLQDKMHASRVCRHWRHLFCRPQVISPQSQCLTAVTKQTHFSP